MLKIIAACVQSQLRSQLLAQLQGLGLAQVAPAHKQRSAWQRVADDMVLDYMSSHNYQFSMSVFQPESGCSPAGQIQHQDMLELINLAPDSVVYKLVLSKLQQQGEKHSLLVALLQAVASLPHEQAQQPHSPQQVGSKECVVGYCTCGHELPVHAAAHS
jgi:hypothetical protein